MKNLLIYQSTEYDCGPTTLTNAIRYLFLKTAALSVPYSRAVPFCCVFTWKFLIIFF